MKTTRAATRPASTSAIASFTSASGRWAGALLLCVALDLGRQHASGLKA